MTSAAQHSTPAVATWGGRTLVTAAVWGALAGVGASVVMAMYAMIAAWTYQHSGFFTPLSSTVGYPTFILEHLMFGAALGILLLRASRTSADQGGRAART